MDRYQRVEKPRPEEPIKENEIRITAHGLIRNYISYATTILQDNRVSEIVVKAMGQAISKAVAIAEIIKKRIPGLYQETFISSTTITDAYEPIEEGLEPLEMTRQVSLISITLSTIPLNKNSPGYQAPSTTEQLNTENLHQLRLGSSADVNQDSYVAQDRFQGRGQNRFRARGRGRGRGRGRYGNYQEYDGSYNMSQGYYENYQGENDGYYNRSRGGYGSYQDDEDGYYNGGRGGARGQGRGRGRGWSYRGTGYERGRGGGRGYETYGYERGRGGGRGYGTYGRGRGRSGFRGRGGYNQA